MSASAVQFRGIETVVLAYKNNRIGPWAIHNGKNILFSSEGVGIDDVETGGRQLEQILRMMSKGGTEAKYMLAVYRIEEEEEIDSATPYFRSFNFTVFEIDEPYVSRGNAYAKEVVARMERLEAIVLKMTQDGEEEEEEEEGIMGALKGLAKNPQVIQAIAGFLMNKIGIMPSGQLGKVGAMGATQGAEGKGQEIVLSKDQLDKTQQALQMLVKLDPELGDHLLKIANIAGSDPGKYKMFASML